MAFLPDDLSFQPHDERHFVPNSHFHGTDVVLLKRSVSFSSTERCDDLHNSGEDELSDDGLHLVSGEKKRRLKLEQVKALEKSFDLGSKLEPERKLQLARATGLQPRQIAIWFQNRRARWKTKQLERDYNLLKKQFDAVKAHNDTLQAENHKLHAQLLALKSGEPNGAVAISLKREPKEDSWNVACGAEGDSDIDASRTRLFPPLPLRPAYVTLDHQHQGSSSADVAQYYTDIGNASQDGGFYGMIEGAEEGRPELWSWPELAHHFH